MRGFPSPVLDYLHTFTLETRSPAYLQTDTQGRLREWGGKLSTYGISSLHKGAPIGTQAHFLEGLLPLEESPLCLPCIETASGVFADIHIFPAEQRIWVLLLDTTAEEAQRRLLQQKANDVSLMHERQTYLSRQPPRSYTADREVRVPPLAGDESACIELFAALQMVILERLQDSSFRIIGAVPEWFRHLHPDAAMQQEGLRPDRTFLFLENFLIDAESFWQEQRSGKLVSGLWSEIDQGGNEYFLEASAICWQQRKILLIAFSEIEYQEKQRIIQIGRESRLRYHRFDKELQKRDVLLHCIVHDLAGPLTAMLGYFALLDFENLTLKAKGFVKLGLQQASRQEALIRQILDVFSAEMRTLESYTPDFGRAPDVARCVQAVVEALLPAATLKNTHLQLAPIIEMGKDWKVVGEKSRLERVIFNLVENALRHGPWDSTVTVDVRADGGDVLIIVDDEGRGVPPDNVGTLFEKFSQGGGHIGKAGLGLYFCRITVEHWGGSIGYTPRSEGGSRFWFRLPRPGRS